MWSNYFKIALRSLAKNKSYTFINVLGLSVGLACCILILLHVRDEMSYDRFHEDSDRLLRMVLERQYPNYDTHYAVIPSGFAQVVAENIPEVEASARLVGFPDFASIVVRGDVSYDERFVFWADPALLDILTLTMVRGETQNPLAEPRSMLVNESVASKYFPGEDPIGKTLEINGDDHKITGVFADLPAQSHLKVDFIRSSVDFPFLQNPNYTSFSSFTYLKLKPGADPETVEAKIPALVDVYAAGQIERELGISYADYRAAGNGYRYYLQSVPDIHLHSNLESEIRPNGNIMYVYLFLSVSAFILLIAAINFVNLATARSVERAKEVGVRKVMGSDRSQLVFQFLSESVLLSMLSLICAVVIIEATLPFFNQLAGKQLELSLLSNWVNIPVLLAFAAAIGVLAGLYPAFFISSLQPVSVMKGRFASSGRGRVLRNGLVVFQFAISIVLMAGTFMVTKQLAYIQDHPLGFDQDRVMWIDRADNTGNVQAFKRALENVPGVESAAGASMLPGGYSFGINLQADAADGVLTAKGFAADEDFLETLGIHLMAGRDFADGFNDSLSVILNQTAVTGLGVDDPVGLVLYSPQTVNGEEVRMPLTVVGVVEDFHFESLHTPITPMVIVNSRSGINFAGLVALRVSEDETTMIDRTKAVWDEFAPGRPFMYHFLRQDLNALYAAEQTSGRIFATFATLAILVACVGLFGLAAYTTYQRTKEIGVRKVLGASAVGIAVMLTKDFTKLVGIAFLIAVPLAWWLIDSWLSNFAYRASIGIWTFVIPGGLALAVAWLTVAYKAVGAARVNPVKSLRSE